MTAGEARALEGRAFPAGSSREVAAVLTVTGGHAALQDAAGAVLAQAILYDLDIDMPVGRAPRRVTFPDGTLFQTEDREGITALRPPSWWDRLSRLEVFGPRLALFVVAAVLGALAVWRFALPAMVSLAVTLTPPPLVQAMDRGVLQTLDLSLAEPSRLPEAERARARAILDRLRAHLPPEEAGTDLRLEFRDLPGMGPNALALPGGTLVLTDALVTGFPDDDVIAGVLAHEIGHVVEAHGLKQVYRSLGIYVLVALIAGDPGPILEDVLLEGGVLLSLSYSRAHETEADAYALRLADRAGYDPAGLLAFFESLPAAATERSSWTSTHPAPAARMAAIRAYLSAR